MSCECDFCEYHLKMRQIKRGEGLVVTEYVDPKNPSEKAYYDVGGGGGGAHSNPTKPSMHRQRPIENTRAQIQIACSMYGLYVLCDDGSIWFFNGDPNPIWKKLPNIPQQ